MKNRVSPQSPRNYPANIKYTLSKQVNAKSLQPQIHSHRKYFQSKTECNILNYTDTNYSSTLNNE